jgi:hypothetical protein
MLRLKYLLLSGIAFAASLFVHAQEQIELRHEKSYFDVSANYLSNAVYFGRKDSAFTRYFRPSISYHHKSGLYVDVGLSYQTGNAKQKRTDLFSIDAGYEFYMGERIQGDLHASRLFFKNIKEDIFPDLKGIAGFNMMYDTYLFEIDGSADLYFSKNKRLITRLGISREFEIGKKLSIIPGIHAISGTQYYYYDDLHEYITPDEDTILTATWKKKISLLDYEISVPVIYETKWYGIYLIPTYAIPKNPVNFEIDEDEKRLNRELLIRSFFVELGVHFKIR